MLCHRAETGFVGAPVGIMDHMVCSLGDREHALFLDAATMQCGTDTDYLRDIELGVVDSGLSHSHASGEYRTRRRECEEAAGRLGVSMAARDHARAICRCVAAAACATQPARASRRHRECCASWRCSCDRPCGRQRPSAALFLESHASMRDDFEVSTPEIDASSTSPRGDPDVFGARLTGGGFGGAVVIMCAAGKAAHRSCNRTADAYAYQRRDTTAACSFLKLH